MNLGRDTIKSRFIIWLIHGLFLVGAGLSAAAPAIASPPGPNLLPFGKMSAAPLLQKTVEAKMLPCVIREESFTLTVNKLQYFRMDWEKCQFTLKCSFGIESGKYGAFKETGEITLVGTGMLAPAEQKLGVKLLGITGLKLNGALGNFSEGIQLAVDKTLAGKEYWNGPAPAAGVKLTGDNFATMIKVAISQQLPWTGSTKASSITFLELQQFTLMPEPGKISAEFTMQGRTKSLFCRSFAGTACAQVEVWVDPDRLSGVVRIDKIIRLRLDGTPRFVGTVIRGLLNLRLKGEEIRFTWK